MASDTIPVAVPGPNDPPEPNLPTGPVAGMFTSMLTPVDPARPAHFDLIPATAEDAPGTAATGTSSAAYHGGDEEAPRGGTVAAGRQQQGIWRAWLLAGAARWGRGGGAYNKRLEVAKAKAQALQVKEARRVSINRSDGLPGRASAASGPGGKSLGSKNASGGSVRGPRNSNGGANNGGAHRGSDGPSGRNGSSGTGSGPGGRGHGGAGAAGGSGGGPTPKPTKNRDSKAGAPGEAGSGKNGAPGRAGSPGKNGSSGATVGKSSGPSSSPTGGKRDNSGKGSGTKDRSGAKASRRPDGPSSKDAGPRSADKAGPAGSAGTAGKNGAPGTGGGRVSLTKPDKNAKTVKTDKADRGTTTGAKDSEPSKTPAAGETAKDGKPFTTRESREAGYRDGTRAAKAAAHVKAYRDGVKDGWADTSEAADREKTRLDAAHETRKKTRLDSEQEQPVSGNSADYHEIQPIDVKEVNGLHVILGDGATRESMSRGEVRSLKSFERRLDAKAESMKKIAEDTKGLQSHADQQAKQATQLLEAAKAVKSGEKLAGALAKLEEAAKVQSGKAEEIHKRAVRAAEACCVVLINVETRYGGIYRAVVDSDETSPAELAFYKG